MLTEKTQELAAGKSPEKMADKMPEKIAEKRRALGRGLESLLPGSLAGSLSGSGAGSGRAVAAGGPQPGVVDIIHAQAAQKPGQEVVQLRLEEISPNPFQTRSRMDENY